MKAHPFAALLLTAPLLAAAQDPTGVDGPEPGVDRAVPGGELVVPDPEGRPLLLLPRDEELVYEVHVGVAFLDAAVGTVTQTSKVEPFQRSVLLPAAASGDEAGETATLKIHAEGSYAIYKLDSTIEARHLPQAWPRIVYRITQSGSSHRRRENMIGLRDGAPRSNYRRDTSDGAPRGTRIWKEPQFRDVPPGTLDMLSAVFACRTLVREGLDAMTFPMVEKDRLWEFTIRRGEQKRMKTRAGTFDVVEIQLDPQPWPDEEIDEEKRARFEGLFGMQGAIQIWADRATGVPVRIQGDLPAGPFTITIDVVLKSYAGTPEGFRPVGAR